jgi:tetratricopeptide (TPR) repeat protein
MRLRKGNRHLLGNLALIVLCWATAAPARVCLGTAARESSGRKSPGPRRPRSACVQAAVPQAAPSDSELRDIAHGGVSALMDGDPGGAIEIFRRIQKADPESPLGYVLEADAVWWKIYLTTGNLIDPDVFDVARSSTSPYDFDFQDLVNVAIRKAAVRIHEGQDEARNHLYEGLAYGLRGRFDGLRDNNLPTARAAKKMRQLLLTALKMDASLEDAYLGLGVYNYFVDTLPGIVKALKFLIGLPGGSRELGLEQLRRAAEEGELTAGEAKFYLGKDFSRSNERQYSESLALFQELAREYPENMLWTLLVGSVEIRLGHARQGDDLYREAFTKTTGMKSEVGQALHREARRALARRHPNERFDD